jgi:hypothetical protein
MKGELVREPFGEPSANEWLSVTEVARLEGLTVRAVQRRCQAGKYTTRRVAGEKGEVWEISLFSLPVEAQHRANPSANEDERGGEPFAHRSPNKNEPREEGTGREKELKEEILFLRGLVEGHQRSEAELRAALREALRAMPRQLPLNVSEGSLEDAYRASVGNVPQTAPEAVETYRNGPQTQTGTAPRREPRPLWKLVLGIR